MSFENVYVAPKSLILISFRTNFEILSVVLIPYCMFWNPISQTSYCIYTPSQSLRSENWLQLIKEMRPFSFWPQNNRLTSTHVKIAPTL